METITGFLLPIWISVCILAAMVLSIPGRAGLICTIAPLDLRGLRLETFNGFVCCSLLAGLFYIHVWYPVEKPQETSKLPETRDILLTVPKDSSVSTQITSGNNIVNIKNL